MKVSLLPVVQQFKLKGDPDQEATITVRQISTGDAIKLGDLFADQTQRWDDENNPLIDRKWNPARLVRARSYCSLVAIDLEDDDGKRIFRSNSEGTKLEMSQTEFNKAWDALPQELTREIYENVVLVNPQWAVASGE